MTLLCDKEALKMKTHSVVPNLTVKLMNVSDSEKMCTMCFKELVISRNLKKESSGYIRLTYSKRALKMLKMMMEETQQTSNASIWKLSSTTTVTQCVKINRNTRMPTSAS